MVWQDHQVAQHAQLVPYRDELEAALARAEALANENAALKQQLAGGRPPQPPPLKKPEPEWRPGPPSWTVRSRKLLLCRTLARHMLGFRASNRSIDNKAYSLLNTPGDQLDETLAHLGHEAASYWKDRLANPFSQ